MPTFYFGIQNFRVSSTAEKIRDIARRAAEARGLEFVHAEIAGTKRNAVVRVFVDRSGGITIDDCGELSRDIEAVLDEVDIIPSAYVLEVSSPGLERELYSIDDFRKFTGKNARVKISEEIDGRKSFKGTIEGVDGETVLFRDRSVGEVSFLYSAVVKANLVYDVADDLKKG